MAPSAENREVFWVPKEGRGGEGGQVGNFGVKKKNMQNAIGLIKCTFLSVSDDWMNWMI